MSELTSPNFCTHKVSISSCNFWLGTSCLDSWLLILGMGWWNQTHFWYIKFCSVFFFSFLQYFIYSCYIVYSFKTLGKAFWLSQKGKVSSPCHLSLTSLQLRLQCIYSLLSPGYRMTIKLFSLQHRFLSLLICEHHLQNPSWFSNEILGCSMCAVTVKESICRTCPHCPLNSVSCQYYLI